MDRMFIDCREFPSEKGCTVAICADNDKELLEAAVQHAVAVHGHQDSAEVAPADPSPVQERYSAATGTGADDRLIIRRVEDLNLFGL